MKNLFITIIVITASTAMAQVNPSTKLKDMKSMVGSWEGNGWFIDSNSNRIEFSQREEISYELGGTALLIKGKGFNEDKVVHNAIALLSYDLSKQGFDMYSMLADGKRTHADFRIIEQDKFEWQFEVPGGTVKYLIVIDSDVWKENGLFSPDGTNWYPFIEFTLTRV